MFFQWIWFSMMGASLLYACLTGRAGQMLPAALRGTGDAIALTLSLGAGYLFFCGLIAIVNALDVPRKASRALRPVLRALMPSVQKEETRRAITMNLTANLLGLGNAATPMGMEAMQRMDAERAANPSVSHAMEMLLIVNATSIQLLPTTVLTLRIAAGSARPNAVLLPTLACTAASTVAGVTFGLLCRRYQEKRHA